MHIANLDSQDFEDPQQLVTHWREQRAYRLGSRLSFWGFILAVIGTLVDWQWSDSWVIGTDLVLLMGCLISWLSCRHSKSHHFLWAPVYVGFWISILPSLLETGGLNSPFLSCDLVLLFIGGVAVQSRIPAIYFLFFSFLHLPLFFLIDRFFVMPYNPPAPAFVLAISGLTWMAIAVCVLEILKTEGWLAHQFLRRYRELIEARAELQKEEASNLAKTTFLANVSHELRTPITSILGYADLLTAAETSSEEQASFLNTIRRNGEQLARLVDDLLDLSKIEVGHLDIERVRFSLRDLLNEVCHLARPAALQKNLKIEVEFVSSVPEFLCSDLARIKQILLNLLGNAIKFTDQGQITLILEYRPEADGTLLISVKDTGRGISEKESDKLFQPFSQLAASTARRYGGTGLGLSLSRRIARLLGGELELRFSRPSEGSVFTLRLPVGVPDSQMQPWMDHLEKVSSLPVVSAGPFVSADFQGRCVLVVDDMIDNQALMRMYLEGAGASVEVASNGREAVEKALRTQYDLVLMDIQMPEMDGYEAVQELRRHHYQKPIFALTAHAMKEDLDRCFAAGCNGYLTKPILRHTLLEAVQQVLPRSA